MSLFNAGRTNRSLGILAGIYPKGKQELKGSQVYLRGLRSRKERRQMSETVAISLVQWGGN